MFSVPSHYVPRIHCLGRLDCRSVHPHCIINVYVGSSGFRNSSLPLGLVTPFVSVTVGLLKHRDVHPLVETRHNTPMYP